jgi:purine-binding chemotaxis protein CheW
MAIQSNASASPQGRSSSAVLSRANKYLTFQLGGESYGLEILKVQEIIGIMTVTRVPRTPGFMRGVINLRGKVIPVIDLRLKFSMASREDTDRTCIIVVRVVDDAREVTMGVIVDEVSEVQTIDESQIEPPPSFGTTMDTEFILGMGKAGDKVVILLDVDRVLSGGEIARVSEVTQNA